MFYIGLLHNLCYITKSKLSTSEYKINAPSKVFEIVLFYESFNACAGIRVVGKCNWKDREVGKF